MRKTVRLNITQLEMFNSVTCCNEKNHENSPKGIPVIIRCQVYSCKKIMPNNVKINFISLWSPFIILRTFIIAEKCGCNICNSITTQNFQ